MTLQDIFDQLTYGELSQLSIGGEAAGVISPANYPRVLAHVRLGLTALYTRFHLKEGRATIQLRPGQVTYLLDTNEDTAFVVSNFEEEFADDILKVEEVLTAGGVPLGLNEKDNAYSCFTPSARVLRLPMDLTGSSGEVPAEFRTDTLTLVYRANHPTIAVGTGSFMPSKVLLELPTTHMEALLMFVASRVNNPIGMTNEFHAGNSYYAKYEAACQRLEMEGMEVDQGSMNTRLLRSGWV